MFLIPQEEECVRVAPAPRDSGELRMALQWEIPLPPGDQLLLLFSLLASPPSLSASALAKTFDHG
jgi:hypothetical protein